MPPQSAAVESLLEFELLLPLVKHPWQPLCKQYCLRTPPSRMHFQRTCQAANICLDFNNLFSLRQAYKVSQAFAKKMPLPCCCIFCESGSDQVLNDVVGIKLLFHGLALTGGGGRGEFSELQVC